MNRFYTSWYGYYFSLRSLRFLQRLLCHPFSVPYCTVIYYCLWKSAFFHSLQVFFPLSTMFYCFICCWFFSNSSFQQPITLHKNLISADCIVFKSFCVGTDVSFECNNADIAIILIFLLYFEHFFLSSQLLF